MFKWMWGGIAALAAILAVVTWFAWPTEEIEPPRAKEYRDYDMCLLTDNKGITGEPAAMAWVKLHEVSTRTSVRLSYLAVSGDQTETRARLFVATQVQQNCQIIVAVGQSQVAAAAALAPSYPSVKFFPVASEADAAGVGDRVAAFIPAK